MIYRTKCTHSISLLKNCKLTKDCKYTYRNGEVYVQVKNYEVYSLCHKIEYYQDLTFKYYNELLELKY